MATGSLRDRLHWDSAAGALHDGPRRYLMMRPDVLMGAIAMLDAPGRRAMLDALAASAQQQGGDSLRAYAASVNGDARKLITATVDAAADLGWGVWVVEQQGESMALEVRHSPFAAGWLAAGATQQGGAAAVAGPDSVPICAPIRGLFAALGEAVARVPMQVHELRCAAQGHAECRFVAAPAGCDGDAA